MSVVSPPLQTELSGRLRSVAVNQPGHMGARNCGKARTVSGIARRRGFEIAEGGIRRGSWALISGGRRGHRLANVVHQRQTPTGRIRRGDPPERHGFAQFPDLGHLTRDLSIQALHFRPQFFHPVSFRDFRSGQRPPSFFMSAMSDLMRSS